MRGIPFRLLASAGLWLLTSCAGAAPLLEGPLPGAGAGGPWIRVLLFEGLDEVEIRDANRGRRLAQVVLVPGRGLRIDGGALVPSWRSPASDLVLEVRGRRVRGVVEVIALAAGSSSGQPASAGLAVVNELPLERYLAGTLGREMYGSWGEEALRVQAVASRTYVLHQRERRRGDAWHVTSGTQSQVYGGVDAESEVVLAALAATRGEILTRAGTPILAAFHSSSGGRTASAEEVWGEARDYLVSVPVEDEWDSPDAYWRAPVTRTTLGRAVASLGNDVGPIVAARVSRRTDSGRVDRIELQGERGAATVSGRQLRSALGESKLKSTLFELREHAEGFVFVGSGNGHGVGMSQWGARAMARRGDDYRSILRAFYPGTRISRVSGDGPESLHGAAR